MAYKIQSKKGRPSASYKIRGIKGMTPKGFEFHEIKGKIIVFKKKGVKK